MWIVFVLAVAMVILFIADHIRKERRDQSNGPGAVTNVNVEIKK